MTRNTEPTPLSTKVVEIGPGRIELDAAELHVISGPDKGMRVPLGPESVRIGTGSECEIVLHDPTISKRHAEVIVTPRGFVLRDLESKNGVMLSSWRVERVLLADKMQLKLGASTLAVKALGQKHQVPLVKPGQLGALVAHSVKMRAVVALLEKFAAADTTVLIEGETGTGKEVAAQALHDASPRAQGPFVVFDCGASPPTLIAAELFGHERGAYSGAEATRPGLLEQAHGGTLFLDEIGEIPLDVQPVLLRAIERKTCRRVGGAGEVSFDVRVMAATNRNLQEEVRGGRFREDLFFRLAVGRVRLPPLRERPEDLTILAHIFAAELGVTLTPEFIALLSAYDWPGNVRELHNTIANTAVQPETMAALAHQMPRAEPGTSGEKGSFLPLAEARRVCNESFERRYLKQVLAATGGNVTHAARLAGVSRQFLTRLAAKYGMRWRDRMFAQ